MADEETATLKRSAEVAGLEGGSSDTKDENKPRKILKTVKVVRVLCPNYSVGSILGKGGERIKQLKDSSGSKISISKQGCVFPVLNERYVSVMADCDTLKDVIEFIQARIREDSYQPKGSNETTRYERRKRVCKLVVSDKVIGKIIGKAGENIKNLKNTYGVMVNTSNKKELPFDLPERVISIEGDPEKIQACVNEIISDIHDDERANLDFFVDYTKYQQHRESTAASGEGGFDGQQRSIGYDMGAQQRPSAYPAFAGSYAPQDYSRAYQGYGYSTSRDYPAYPGYPGYPGYSYYPPGYTAPPSSARSQPNQSSGGTSQPPGDNFRNGY